MSVEEAMRRADAIDLEPVIFKLVTPDPGDTPLSLKEADRRAGLYRQYMALNLMYPHEPIVPTREIDSMWHQHILDTRKYAEDCEQLYGFFLHHFPYFGLRGVEDEKNWVNQGQITYELFLKHFGINLTREALAECQHTGCTVCESCTSYTGTAHQERPRPDRGLAAQSA